MRHRRLVRPRGQGRGRGDGARDVQHHRAPRPGRRGHLRAERLRLRHAPPLDRRPGRRPPADGERRRALRHHLQRRDLQLSGAAQGAGSARPSLPHQQRHREHPARLRGLGRRRLAEARGHVRGRDLGPAQPHGHAGARSAGHQALLLHAAERRPRLGLGAEDAHPGAGSQVHAAPEVDGRVFRLRPGARALHDLRGGAEARAGLHAHPRPLGRAAHRALLGIPLPAGAGSERARVDRRVPLAVPRRGEAPPAGRRPARRVPLGRRRLLRGGRRHDQGDGRPGAHLHHRLRGKRVRRVALRAPRGAAPRLPPYREARQARRCRDHPAGARQVLRRAVRRPFGDPDLVRVAPRARAGDGGDVRRRRR